MHVRSAAVRRLCGAKKSITNLAALPRLCHVALTPALPPPPPLSQTASKDLQKAMESSLRNLADDGVEDLHQLRSAVDQVGFARSVWSVMGWPSGPVGKQIISFDVNFYKIKIDVFITLIICKCSILNYLAGSPPCGLPLRAWHPWSHTRHDMLQTSLIQVITSRGILAWSYVFKFYEFEDDSLERELQLFETLQGKLEHMTEDLQSRLTEVGTGRLRPGHGGARGVAWRGVAWRCAVGQSRTE